MTSHWSRKLHALGACRDAVEWAGTQQSYAVAWKACPRGDWLLWLLGRTAGEFGSASHRGMVGAASACARTALSIFEAARPSDGRVRGCLDLLDRYAAGEAVTRAQIDAAWAAAWDAARAAGATGAWAAARAAGAARDAGAAGAAARDAAGAAWVAAGAASAAAWAAGDADGAAGAAAWAAAWAAVLAQCADIVREKAKRPELDGKKES